jgi:hypothetical protein
VAYPVLRRSGRKRPRNNELVRVEPGDSTGGD